MHESCHTFLKRTRRLYQFAIPISCAACAASACYHGGSSSNEPNKYLQRAALVYSLYEKCGRKEEGLQVLKDAMLDHGCNTNSMFNITIRGCQQKKRQLKLKLWKIAAHNGNISAAWLLGNALNNRTWIQKAANDGHPVAQNRIGEILLTYQSQWAAAYGYFQKAASHGFPCAIRNLGFMYLGGKHVTKDIKYARWLYARANKTSDP
jgi:TPR repeat protein